MVHTTRPTVTFMTQPFLVQVLPTQVVGSFVIDWSRDCPDICVAEGLLLSFGLFLLLGRTLHCVSLIAAATLPLSIALVLDESHENVVESVLRDGIALYGHGVQATPFAHVEDAPKGRGRTDLVVNVAVVTLLKTQTQITSVKIKVKRRH